MLEYIYFVKCPNCEDEPFTFFDEAKEFALGRMSAKPIITQIEVTRNDFGECTDSCDLGTVWSWEDMMTDAEPSVSVFTKDDLKHINNGEDPEFDGLDNSLDFNTIEDAVDFLVKDEEEAIAGYEDVKDAVDEFDVENKKEVLDTLDHIKEEEEEHIEELEALLGLSKTEPAEATLERKPIPEGMTIEQLVEEMEENEDTVECTLCQELYDKDQCRKELNLGWLCGRCADGLISRGEDPVFHSNNYWDFLDEEALKEAIDISGISTEDFFKALSAMKKEFGTNCKVTIDEINNFITNWVESSKKLEPVEESCEQYDSLNTLEEADDYRNHLTLCPECGAEEGLDKDTGICIECGFNFEGI